MSILMKRHSTHWVVMWVILSSLMSCGWRKITQPSILVLAVEDFGFDSFSCGNEDIYNLKDWMGFKVFCEESVRFTHAYTPSVMSQPALSSLFTGLYPFEHGVWHNGSQFLSAEFETAAEFALKKNYRTSFFSGGPPIWRKSGLFQGFEVFEDNIKPHLAHLYRPVEESFAEYLTWLEKESSHEPFFSFLFIPDLQFPEVATHNDLGEERERSSQGQLREISESLNGLIQKLKLMERWDNTYVFLLGLNSHPRMARWHEEVGYNLFSEGVQVALYIKPARKKRDLGIEWKIDQNVSLVDVGATLFDLLGKSPLPQREENLPVVSLKSVFDKPQVSWDPDRNFLIESGWPEWQGWGSSRFSVRWGHYLVLYDNFTHIYNTLIDRQEMVPLPIQDPFLRSFDWSFNYALKERKFLPWSDQKVPIKKLEIAKKLWAGSEITKDSEEEKDLIKLIEKNEDDPQIRGWWALYLMKIKNWQKLGVLGQKWGQKLWEFVAAKNRGYKINLVKLKDQGCLPFFLHEPNQNWPDISQRDCDDALMFDLVQWMKEKDANLQLVYRDRFMRLYLQELTDRMIYQKNYLNGLKWDIDDRVNKEPLMVELLLSLPSHRKFENALANRILRENQNLDLSPSF